MFRDHWRLVLGYLVRRTGNVVLAEELAQETFYKATRAFLGWSGQSPAAWLMAIARNVVIDDVRRSSRISPLPPEEIPMKAQEDLSPFEFIDLLDRLPLKHGQLLRWVYVDGFSHAEIAISSGMSVDAVKAALYRARKSAEELYGQESNHE